MAQQEIGGLGGSAPTVQGQGSRIEQEGRRHGAYVGHSGLHFTRRLMEMASFFASAGLCAR